MTIIINTDNHIKGSEDLKERLTAEATKQLQRFDEFITRTDVFFSDENQAKTGPADKKCVVEVRMKNHEPLAVTYFADTIDHALAGALDKIKSVLDTRVGKLQNH